MSDSNHKEEMKKLQKEQREKVKAKYIDRGILVVNTGDGKGKSTAAFGTAVRAVGHGYKVAVVQFIKGNWSTGEQKIFEHFDEITHIVSGDGFTWDTQDKSKDIESAESGWKKVCELIEECRESSKYHLIVLDELNIALSYGYLAVDKVVEVLKNKPEKLNIMVTGRGAPEELIAIADTVTEMKPIKHAFDNGIQAQRGIEF
ncbi:cob(I)yrinic acid a,c-diamide adenosyltransferase [Lentisphaera marina]|uniref:cob(I)yrinic acid a,c-diamide adenosyltransferase n=1 Tax=Lentisphaera marina TaxID=1111041 RepID=UPI0023665FC8|nr:cob(I)yrinic acid a,c-diamide adenosyltransferase [Lentisphaera marina]MDD7986784.1 cob(I)yrinic acid a,c-diamide adenosyltransferase [Lentisphaera marina]